LSDATTSAVMPGGGIARRPLHCFILADCSGSMKGEKMQALNFAIADMLPHLAAWERDQEQAAVFVRVIAFATEPTWHVAEPTSPASLRWSPLASVERGLTNMAPVFEMVAEALSPGQLERRALRPAVLLVTDGLPTDPPERFDSALETLVSGRAGRAALRLAVAIGRDAKSEALTRFIGDPSVPVLVADNTDEIAERLVVASLAVSRMSEVGADKQAIASQLLQPQVPAAAPLDLDTIV
jgi:uncharacterized protein YegL